MKTCNGRIKDLLIYLGLIIIVSAFVVVGVKKNMVKISSPTDISKTTVGETEVATDSQKRAPEKDVAPPQITEPTSSENKKGIKAFVKETKNVEKSVSKKVEESKVTATQRPTGQSTEKSFDYPKLREKYGTFSCRRLGINDLELFYGDDDYCLHFGVGTSAKTTLPGFGARTLISAHNQTFFAPMSDISEGDIFELDLNWGYYRYRVYKIKIMTPSEFDVGLIREPSDEIIVYTCYGGAGTNYRIFMFCEMLEGPRMY